MGKLRMITCAYYGKGISNTYLALEKYCKEKNYHIGKDENIKSGTIVIPIECENANKINDMLQLKDTDYALIPIVNSDSGIVKFSSELLFNNNYEVVAQIENEIKLFVYGLKEIKDFKSVKGIFSNNPALLQCSEFINKNFPFAVFYYASSTTEAVEKLIEKNDPNYVCIANEKASKYPQLVKLEQGSSSISISNGGETKTRFFFVKKREAPIKIANDIISGNYIYISKNDGDSFNSVSPASWRFVNIKKVNGQYTINGFAYGFDIKKLFKSLCTSFSKINKDNYVFFYEYRNESKSNVNGLARLTIDLPRFKQYGKFEGIYCGKGNRKSGILSFIKITDKEFELYRSGCQNEEEYL